MSLRKSLFFVLGLVVSFVFLIFTVRGLNPEDVGRVLRNANAFMIFFAAGFYILPMFLISYRWKFVLDDTVKVQVGRLFPLVAIGYMGNNIYPFRAGEFLRLALLRQGWKVPVVRGATTILVERCFDGIVMLTFLLVPALLIDLQSELVNQVAIVAAPAFVGALVVFLSLAQRPDAFRRLVKAVTDRLPAAVGSKLAAISHDIIDGLSALRRPRDLLGVVVFSYGSWMFEAVVYLLVAVAVGLPTDYLLMLMVLGAVNLGGLIPASPGGVGVFEFLASTILIAAGVPAEQALAYALLVHMVIWVPPTVIGLLMLPQMGLRLSAVARARDLADANG